MPRLGIPEPLSRIDSVLVRAGNDVDAAAFTIEDNLAVDQCEQRVILALAYAFARMKLGAQLTNEDVAGDDLLAAITLNTAALSV